MSKYDELLEEAHRNIKEDRDRLAAVLEDLRNSVSSDPELKPMLLKSVIFATDGLTRVNSQLVELVRIEARKAPASTSESGLTADEKEKLMEEIGDDGRN